MQRRARWVGRFWMRRAGCEESAFVGF